MFKKATLIIVIITALVIFGLTYILIISNSKPEHLYRTGQIEMREYDLSSKIPGRIEWINVDEGDEIRQGDTLLKLTDREIRSKFMQAEGSVESAKAQLNMLKAGLRTQEIELARQSFEAATSQFDLAEKTYNRFNEMFKENLLSAQELDVVFQKYQAAKAQKEAARLQLNLATEGARSEQKDIAAGQLVRAKESMNEVGIYLDESYIISPINGLVSKRYVDNFELAAVGYPVLSIIDPQDVWVELNLPSNELELLKIGDILKAKIDGSGETADFKVENFSVLSDFANWRSASDKSTYDIRSYTLKLKPIGKLSKSVRPGMTVRFDLNTNG